MNPSIPVTILAILDNKYTWLPELQEIYTRFVLIESEASLITELNDLPLTLIILDENEVSDDLEGLVFELKNRFPSCGILLLVGQYNHARHIQLLESGADDVIANTTEVATIQSRLQLLAHHQAKKHALLQQSNELHALSILTQQLYDADSIQSLTEGVISALCNRFNIQGVAITLAHEQHVHMTSGGSRNADKIMLDVSMTAIEKHNPLHQVALSDLILIFPDIMEHQHFEPIAVIPAPRATLIIPLKSGQERLGSIALFFEKIHISTDIVAHFELLASHFVSAYNKVQYNHEREAAIIAREHMVHAWQTLAPMYEVLDVIKTSYEQFIAVESVEEAITFAFETTGNQQEILVYSDTAVSANAASNLYHKGSLHQLMELFTPDMSPITLFQQDVDDPHILNVFNQLQATEIMFVPIHDTMFIGGIFLTRRNNFIWTNETVNLFQRLAHATAVTIERNGLIQEIQQQTGRMEAIIRSIRDALFFVNPDGMVIFCNPQFSELTGLNPSRVIGSQYQELIQSLAESTKNPEDTHQQFEQTIQSFLQEDSEDDDYPAVSFQMVGNEQDLSVEFIKSNPNQPDSSWIGFVIQDSRKPQQDNELIATLLEDAFEPLLRLQQTAALLADQYETLRPRKYLQQLGQLQDKINETQVTWKNILRAYQIESYGIHLNLELVDIADLMEDIVESYLPKHLRNEVTLKIQPPRVKIKLDEQPMIHALAGIIEFMVAISWSETPILIQMAPEAEGLTIRVQSNNIQFPGHFMENLFDLSNRNMDMTDVYPYQLGIYLSRETIIAHGGVLELEQQRTAGMGIKIILPINDPDFIPDEKATSVSRTMRTNTLTVMTVDSAAHLIRDFDEVIYNAGHEIFTEISLKDALLNLNLTQIDLLIIEDAPASNDVVQMTRKIREESDIPILLVAEANRESICIQALNEGIDSYVLTPITKDKLLALIESVAKRKDILSRVTPPMQIGDLHIDLSRRRVYLGNKLLELSAKEYELLQVLALNKEKTLTHTELLTEIWGPEYREETQYLWVNISRLRRKLEPTKGSPRYIQTAKGVGYIFREP